MFHVFFINYLGYHTMSHQHIAVVNLTLIDLPGMTKVAVGNFPIFSLVHNIIAVRNFSPPF